MVMSPDREPRNWDPTVSLATVFIPFLLRPPVDDVIGVGVASVGL